MRIRALILVGLMLLLTLSAARSYSAAGMEIKAQAPILIHNDTELENLAQANGWGGDGTQGNPYVIENYTIDAQGTGPAIYIGNITKYVVIRNSMFYNASGTTPYNGSAVYIENASNVVRLENVFVYSVKEYGFYVAETDGIVLDSCIFEDRGTGAVAGMLLYHANYATIKNSSIYGSTYGLYLYVSHYTKLYGNRFTNASISIRYSYFADRYVIPSNNTVNGKHVLYITGNGNNQSIDASGAGEVILGNAMWVTVKGYSMANLSSGVLVLDSSNITLENFEIVNATAWSMHFYFADNVTLINGTLGEAYNRIHMDLSHNIVIDGLDVYGTGYGYGVYTSSSYNLLVRNMKAREIGYGIFVVGQQARNIVVENSIFTDMAYYGVYVYSGSTSNPVEKVRIANSTFNGTFQYAVYLLSISDSEIVNNTITTTQVSSDVSGIYVGGFSSYVSIAGNVIVRMHEGLHLASVNHIYVRNNIVNESGYAAIYTLNFQNSEISGNRVNGSANYGMRFNTNSNYNEIFDNVVENCTGYAMYFYSSTQGNVIYNNSFYFNHGSTSQYDASKVQAYDASGNNAWNTTHGGNYWLDWAMNNDTNDGNSDGIVDWPYLLDGGAGVKDEKPLKEPAIPELNLFFLVLLVLLVALVLRKP